MVLLRKIKSAIFYVKQYLKRSEILYDRYKQQQLVLKWIKAVRRKKPRVLLGANIMKPNGVDFHLRAIHKYSSLSTSLVPGDSILGRISMSTFLDDYIDRLDATQKSVLHSHVYPKYILWCQAQKIKNGSIKWIHTYHAHYFPEYAENDDLLDWQKEFNRTFVEVASKADIKISVSRWQQDFYKTQFDIDTIYIPNGVNVEQCEQAEPAYFSNKYGVSRYIINVSRHDPVKNPGEFVALAKVMPQYTFVIIGSNLTPQLFREHYQMEPPPNLKIFGKMSQMEVQHAIAGSICLVSTSKKEGLPTLVLEAMAQAKPVVVSNEPGSMEAIAHGRYGYFYELGDISDLKAKTQKAVVDQEIALKARQRVLQEYDWRVVIKKLDSLYND